MNEQSIQISTERKSKWPYRRVRALFLMRVRLCQWRVPGIFAICCRHCYDHCVQHFGVTFSTKQLVSWSMNWSRRYHQKDFYQWLHIPRDDGPLRSEKYCMNLRCSDTGSQEFQVLQSFSPVSQRHITYLFSRLVWQLWYFQFCVISVITP